MFTMKQHTRILLLRIIYLYTVVGAGTFGVVMFINPDLILTMFPFLDAAPIPFGTLACLWTAFGIAAVWGWFNPLVFAPILIIQLTYKSLWFALVIGPMLLNDTLPSGALTFIVLYGLYIVLDLIAIPFKELLPGRS